MSQSILWDVAARRNDGDDEDREAAGIRGAGQSLRQCKTKMKYLTQLQA